MLNQIIYETAIIDHNNNKFSIFSLVEKSKVWGWGVVISNADFPCLIPTTIDDRTFLSKATHEI